MAVRDGGKECDSDRSMISGCVRFHWWNCKPHQWGESTLDISCNVLIAETNHCWNHLTFTHESGSNEALIWNSLSSYSKIASFSWGRKWNEWKMMSFLHLEKSFSVAICTSCKRICIWAVADLTKKVRVANISRGPFALDITCIFVWLGLVLLSEISYCGKQNIV